MKNMRAAVDGPETHREIEAEPEVIVSEPNGEGNAFITEPGPNEPAAENPEDVAGRFKREGA